MNNPNKRCGEFDMIIESNSIHSGIDDFLRFIYQDSEPDIESKRMDYGSPKKSFYDKDRK